MLSSRLAVVCAAMAAVCFSVPSNLSAASAQNVGSVAAGSSMTASVTLTFSSGQLSAAPNIAMQYGIEFFNGALSCNGSFTSCTVQVTFAPRYTGVRQDAVIAADVNGNVLETAVLQGTGLGSQIVLAPGLVAQASSGQNNLFVASDQYGNFYFDTFESQILFQTADSLTATVVAGTGASGYSGDGGLAINAELNTPRALALDGFGNLYVADTYVIRKIDLATGIITTIAGTYNQSGSTGDGGPATQALINTPLALTADAQGNLYFLESATSSGGPTAVRQISATTGNISSILRSGIFGGLAADNAGNLYLSNSTGDQIEKLVIGSSTISVYAGTGTSGYSGDGGPALSALLNSPTALATDISGNLYLIDAGNDVVRRVNASSGTIVTVAGGGSNSCCSAAVGRSATSLELTDPSQLSIVPNGDILIVDFFSFYRISSVQGSLTFGTVQMGSNPTRSLSISNIGNLSFGVGPFDLSGPQSFSFSETNTCGSSIASGAVCSASVTFTPTANESVSANLDIGSGVQASLTGAGAGTPRISISPTTLTFTTKEQTPVSLPLTLTNTGNAILNLASEQLQNSAYPSAFSFTYCYSPISPGQSCVVTVTFNPSQPGQYSNGLVFTDTNSDPPQTVTLTGTGTASPVVSLSGSPSFNQQAPGVPSSPIPITVQNIGHAPLNVQSVAFGPGSASDFHESNDCLSPIPTQQSCTIWLTYAPQVGAESFETAQLQVFSNAPQSPAQITVFGSMSGWSPSHINIDSPGSGSSVSGKVTFSGWAFNDYTYLSQVSLFVDGQAIGQAYVDAIRQDVCNAFPNRPNCPFVGWAVWFDTTHLSDGKHQLTVTSVPSGSNFGAAAASVSFTVSNSGTPSATHVWIDQPNNSDGSFNGTARFSGWAVDDRAPIQSVTLEVDNTFVATATYGASRADVCNTFPGRPGCPSVGWVASVDTTKIPDGSHILTAIAQTTDGRYRTVEAPFTVANAQADPIQITIDSPAIGESPANGTLTASGWTLDQSSPIISIAVTVDGTPIQGTLSLPRPDVCAAFPNAVGCPNFGWSADIDTTQFGDGLHTLEVLVGSSDGHHRAATRQFSTSNSGDIASDVVNGWIDTPNINIGSVSGTITVSGWALDHFAPMNSIVLTVDNGQQSMTVTPSVERQDVCVALPNSIGCPYVGWSTSLDTTTLPDGNHTLTMVATAADGHRVVRTSTFTTSNASARANNGEIVWIGSPGENATVSGEVTLVGWAVNRFNYINGVSIAVDGISLGNAQYGISRPDVCAVVASYACPNVGWTYTLDTRLLTNGVHTIWVIAAGYPSAVTTRTITVANTSTSLHASIHQPSGSYSGTAEFSGWALDDTSVISSVQATVDGIPMGAAAYGGSRPDVCAVYPGRPNCPDVGWSISIDTTQFANGSHVFAITAQSSGGDEITISKPFQVSN